MFEIRKVIHTLTGMLKTAATDPAVRTTPKSFSLPVLVNAKNIDNIFSCFKNDPRMIFVFDKSEKKFAVADFFKEHPWIFAQMMPNSQENDLVGGTMMFSVSPKDCITHLTVTDSCGHYKDRDFTAFIEHLTMTLETAGYQLKSPPVKTQKMHYGGLIKYVMFELSTTKKPT
jgi:hypothetical protein